MYLEQAGSWHSSEFLGLHLAVADTIHIEREGSDFQMCNENRSSERGKGATDLNGDAARRFPLYAPRKRET